MTKKKSYTTKEVADLIGVTVSTVNNWAKEGLLPKMKLGSKNNLFPAHIIDNLLPSLIEIRYSELKCEQTLKAVKEREMELRDKEVELRKSVSILNITDIDAVNEIIETFIQKSVEAFGGKISQRDMGIFRHLIKGETTANVAKKVDLSGGRVVQILHRNLRIIKNCKICTNQEEKELRERIRNLEQIVASQEYELGKKGFKAVSYPPIWDAKLKDCNLSVRCLNVLNYAELKTVADLIALRGRDLLKCRNFGKNTLQELENFLQENGLEFETDTSKYKKDDTENA